jgi:hypothetical protein
LWWSDADVVEMLSSFLLALDEMDGSGGDGDR